MLNSLIQLKYRRRSYARRLGGKGAPRSNGTLALILIILLLTLNVPGILFAPISLPLVFLLAVVAVLCIASVILIPIAFGIY